jgi:hypothetical protein
VELKVMVSWVGSYFSCISFLHLNIPNGVEHVIPQYSMLPIYMCESFNESEISVSTARSRDDLASRAIIQPRLSPAGHIIP